MKNIPHHPGKIPIPQMQSDLPVGGNLSPGNVPHKFINIFFQIAHSACKLQFEQLPCAFLYKLLQGFQSCGREIVTAVAGEFERL